MHEHIETLIKKAAAAGESGDAMRFSQAATNCANALMTLNEVATNGGHVPASTQSPAINEDQIKRMVDRFLCWKLPKKFRPDNHISFEPSDHQTSGLHPWPVGTNLFTAGQAEVMVRRMLAD